MGKMPRSYSDNRPRGFGLQGCLASFLVWLLAGMVFVGVTMGDCFDDCPSEHQRAITDLSILVAAIVLNVVLILLIARVRAGSEG
jgi:hypothetical protein